MGNRNRVEELQRAVDGYFAACDASVERFEQKNGAVGYRQIPYTLAGLAHATGLSPAAILAAAEGQGDGKGTAVLSGAVRRIARYLTERALLGELQTSVATAELSRLSGAETEDGDGSRLTVVLDDPEGWCD